MFKCRVQYAVMLLLVTTLKQYTNYMIIIYIVNEWQMSQCAVDTVAGSSYKYVLIVIYKVHATTAVFMTA